MNPLLLLDLWEWEVNVAWNGSAKAYLQCADGGIAPADCEVQGSAVLNDEDNLALARTIDEWSAAFLHNARKYPHRIRKLLCLGYLRHNVNRA